MAVVYKIPGIFVLILAILQTSVVVVHSADILFFAAFGTHSTRISKWPLMEGLAAKGHNVTYVTIFPGPEDPKSKIKIVVPKKWKEAYGSWEDHEDVYQDRKDQSVLKTLVSWSGFSDFGRQSCEALYTDPEFVKWIKYSKFDLVVAEIFWNECAYGMAHFWKAKLAVYGTSTVPPWAHDSFGIPDESSTTHDMIYGFRSDHEMTLFERFVNAINPILMTWHRERYHLPGLEEITRKGLGDEITRNFPSFKEIERNISLLFLTTHFSMDYARSFPPHVVPVGGNVVSKGQAKPLPKEMENFVVSKKSGFIYCSFGSGINLGSFPVAIQNEFISALGQFPDIGFILKTAKELNVTDIPKNVYVTRWAPQQTLLSHPQIKAFITHGGMGSAAETIHFSVPVVCLPLMGEQDYNCDMYVRKGAGVFVEIVDLKQQQLVDAIREILSNKKYKLALNKLTSIFKDRPSPPMENAVWWTEYILRHDNVHEHLVPKNVHQAWWKRRQIDIWLITAALLISVVAVPSVILLAIYRKFARKGTSDSSGFTTKIKKS